MGTSGHLMGIAMVRIVLSLSLLVTYGTSLLGTCWGHALACNVEDTHSFLQEKLQMLDGKEMSVVEAQENIFRGPQPKHMHKVAKADQKRLIVDRSGNNDMQKAKEKEAKWKAAKAEADKQANDEAQRKAKAKEEERKAFKAEADKKANDEAQKKAKEKEE